MPWKFTIVVFISFFTFMAALFLSSHRNCRMRQNGRLRFSFLNGCLRVRELYVKIFKFRHYRHPGRRSDRSLKGPYLIISVINRLEHAANGNRIFPVWCELWIKMFAETGRIWLLKCYSNFSRGQCQHKAISRMIHSQLKFST